MIPARNFSDGKELTDRKNWTGVSTVPILRRTHQTNERAERGGLFGPFWVSAGGNLRASVQQSTDTANSYPAKGARPPPGRLRRSSPARAARGADAGHAPTDLALHLRPLRRRRRRSEDHPRAPQAVDGESAAAASNASTEPRASCHQRRSACGSARCARRSRWPGARWIRRLPEFPPTAFRYRSRTQWLESYADYRRLFEALPPERRAYFALLLWTWQHPSDVERMTSADIDVTDRHPWVIVRCTKNRQQPTKVLAPAELAEVFREEFSRRRKGGMLAGHADRLVKPWPARVRTLPAICERLGLPRITATAARHTGISWAIRKLGIAPSVIAWSGHRSPRMIGEVYGHALKARLGDVTRALDSMRPRVRSARRKEARQTATA